MTQVYAHESRPGNRVGLHYSCFQRNRDAPCEVNQSLRPKKKSQNQVFNRRIREDGLVRELNWIVVSILSASYVGSLVQMRAVFELVVGIATRKTGGMSNRIESILYLQEEEKKVLKNFWRRLCEWGHPYGKWVEDVCPIYARHKPIYHSRLFDICLHEFQCVIDFFVFVAVSKYEIGRAMLSAKLNESNINITDLPLVTRRLCS